MGTLRGRLFGALLGASLLLNAVTLGYLARIGFFERILVVADLVDRHGDRSPARAKVVADFARLPALPGDRVFAGDSLIANGPWAEFYGTVRNRGIRGDTTAGLLGRIDEAIRGRPARLTLLAGTNDLGDKIPDAQIERNYRAILGHIRSASPATRVVVLGVLPVNRKFPGAPNYGNERIAGLNRRLATMMLDFAPYRFVDPGPSLADRSGSLREGYTDDGLHLNHDGYLALRSALDRLAPSESETAPSHPEKATP